LYKSADAESWIEISRIAGAGNSNQVISYNYTDNEYNDNSAYYRLKQTDNNGKSTWFNIISVNCEISGKDPSVSIYPNPFSKSATISINDATFSNHFELRIFNVFGEEVLNTIVTKQLTTLKTSNLPTGIYSYNVMANNKIIQSGKLVGQQ
jgi:hypothetical protein